MEYIEIIDAIGIWQLDRADLLISQLPKEDLMRFPLLSMLHDMRGDTKKGLEYAQRGILEAEAEGDNILLLVSLATLCYTLWRSGENDIIDKTYRRFMEIFSEIEQSQEVLQWYGIILHVRGTSLYERGEHNLAMENFKRALRVRTKINDRTGKAATYNNIGLLYFHMGEYTKALEYLFKSIEESLIVDNYQGIAITYSNIADVYRAVGDYHLVMKFLQMSIELHEKHPTSPHYEAIILKNMGKVARLRGELEKSRLYLNKALNIELPRGNKYRIIETIFNLIFTELDLGNIKQAVLLHKTMQELGPFEPLSPLDFFERISAAIIVKAEDRLRSKLKAQEMFEEIVKDSPPIYDQLITSVLNLVELLFLELQSYDNPNLLRQVKQIVKQIEHIARSQNSYPLQVEALILRAQISLVELKIEETYHLLEAAESFSLEHELVALAKKATSMKKQVEDEIDKWNYLASINAPLFKRISESNILEYLQMVGKIIS